MVGKHDHWSLTASGHFSSSQITLFQVFKDLADVARYQQNVTMYLCIFLRAFSTSITTRAAWSFLCQNLASRPRHLFQKPAWSDKRIVSVHITRLRNYKEYQQCSLSQSFSALRYFFLQDVLQLLCLLPIQDLWFSWVMDRFKGTQPPILRNSWEYRLLPHRMHPIQILLVPTLTIMSFSWKRWESPICSSGTASNIRWSSPNY